MEKTEFILLCKDVLAENGLSRFAGEKECGLYFELLTRLSEKNKVMNLTAITDMRSMILRHIADSLYLLTLCPEDAGTIADVGCGAGFPSLPCAIAASVSFPSLRIVGFDSTAKRIAFVNECADALGLTNFIGICGRAEELSRNESFRENFDVCTARAVSEAYLLSELCLPFVKVGGRMIALKGAKGADEHSAASEHIRILGGDGGVLHEYEISDKGADVIEYRSAIIVSKENKTPSLYPRQYSKILAEAKKRG